MPHVVFAWEIGSGLGHLTPIASLGDAFARRGHRVTAIVPNAGPWRQLLAPLGIDVVELPSNPAPQRSFPISLNYTANLLRNGFWHGPTVASRLDTWRALLNRLEPDLLVLRSCARRVAGEPRGAIREGGDGDRVHAAAALDADAHACSRGFESRLIVLRTRIGISWTPSIRFSEQAGLAVLPTVASLFDGVERFLYVEPELDHYPSRSGDTYLGGIEPAQSLFLPELPPESDRGVFVYLSATNRFLEPVLNALEGAGGSGGRVHRRQRLSDIGTSVQAPDIRYLHTPVDLKRVAGRCRLAITHGGTLSASLLLKRGAKLLVCPEDLEKAVLATRLEQKKLAYSFNWFAPGVDHVATVVGKVLDSTRAPERPAPHSLRAVPAGAPATTSMSDRCQVRSPSRIRITGRPMTKRRSGSGRLRHSGARVWRPPG